MNVKPPFEDNPRADAPEPSIDDCIASIASLAAGLMAAEPGDRVMKGRLEAPSMIEDAAAVYAVTRSHACPLRRKEAALDTQAQFIKAIGRFLPPKGLDGLQRRIEARVKGLWREERKAKREARQERHDATLADAFIEDNEIFRNRRGEVFLLAAGEWRPADLGLAPAIDRFLKDAAADAAEPGELLTSKKRDAVERSVRKSSALPMREVEFDDRRELVGLPQGKVADLRAGHVRPMRPDDLATMRAAVFPCVGPSPVWDRFMRETFCRDADLIAAVKRILGYALTGETSLRKAFILDGHGQNGKSTLCDVLRAILGDYGYSSSSRIVASGYSGHDTIFAALENKRLVEIPETDHTLVLGERFKILTGNSAIAGRGMRENERTIRVRCKLLICANNNVKFDGTSKSFADRLCVIPFRNVVTEPDGGLFGKLMAEAPAILAELLREAKAFYDDPRLLKCAAIDEATAAYIGEADRYAAWFDAEYVRLDPKDLADDLRLRLIEAAGQKTILDGEAGLIGEPMQSLFESWRTFAIAEGDYVGNSKLLSSALRERGFLVRHFKMSRRAVVIGITKRTASEGRNETAFAENPFNS